MKLAKYQPTDAVNRFDQMIDEFFNRNLGSFFGSDYFLSQPSVNILEKETEYLIEVAAPGLEKQDFGVKVEGQNLVISAQKEQQNEEKADGKFLRKEFNYATFSRSFRLPESVEADKIKASCEHGVLKVSVPKSQVEIQKYRTIEIE